MCGGTNKRRSNSQPTKGLSPRVRGNLAATVVPPPGGGSIPACAGEPMGKPMLSYMCRVYPRVCGGTRAEFRSGFLDKGLSPRVRGNRICTQPERVNLRSIPACAGEPWPLCASETLSRVYPRVCGGTTLNRGKMAIVSGLSPRVRGNPAMTACRSASSRSIPACAGEPWCLLLPVFQCGVYPRVCGGTLSLHSSGVRPYGLSPRVRGNRGIPHSQNHQKWSIPACAGEPDCC